MFTLNEMNVRKNLDWKKMMRKRFILLFSIISFVFLLVMALNNRESASGLFQSSNIVKKVYADDCKDSTGRVNHCTYGCNSDGTCKNNPNPPSGGGDCGANCVASSNQATCSNVSIDTTTSPGSYYLRGNFGGTYPQVTLNLTDATTGVKTSHIVVVGIDNWGQHDPSCGTDCFIIPSSVIQTGYTYTWNVNVFNTAWWATSGAYCYGPTTLSTVPPTATPIPTNPASTSSCPATKGNGDADCNGTVDGIDYSIWLNTQWHPGTNQICADKRADFNGDGNVDDTDYQIWKAHFGQ